MLSIEEPGQFTEVPAVVAAPAAVVISPSALASQAPHSRKKRKPQGGRRDAQQSPPRNRREGPQRHGWSAYQPLDGVRCEGMDAFNQALQTYKQMPYHQTRLGELLGMAWWVVNAPQPLPPGSVAHDKAAAYLGDVPVMADAVRCVTLRCAPDGALQLSESMPYLTDLGVEFGHSASAAKYDRSPYTYRYTPTAGAALPSVYMHPLAPESIQTEFSTPRYGKLYIHEEGNLRELYVDGQLVYVILDATQATVCVQAGQHLKTGAVLFAAPRNTVRVVVYDRRVVGRRVPDRRQLDASRPMMLDVVTRWLRQIVEIGNGQTIAPAAVLPMPALVAALSQDAADTYLADPDNLLISRPPFQSSLLAAVGPDGDFAIRAPRSGQLELVEEQPWFSRYAIDGATFTVPSICVPFMQVAVGDAVAVNRVVATWGDRIVQDWSALVQFCGIHLTQLCRDYFAHRCLCRDGGTYVPYAWLSDAVGYDYLALDFSVARRYATSVRSWLASPIMRAPGSSVVRGSGPLQVRLD